MHTNQSSGRPDITAWKQAFGLLAFSSATDAAEVVVAGFHETKDPAEQDKWMEIADCLNAIHASRTAH